MITTFCLFSLKCVRFVMGYMTGFPRKTWKMKMVTEKSLNMTNWPNVMEFCDEN